MSHINTNFQFSFSPSPSQHHTEYFFQNHENVNELCAPTNYVIKMNKREYHFNLSNTILITNLKPATKYDFLYTANNLTETRFIQTKEAGKKKHFVRRIKTN